MKPSQRIEEIAETLVGCVFCSSHNLHEICRPSEAENLAEAIIRYLDEVYKTPKP